MEEEVKCTKESPYGGIDSHDGVVPLYHKVILPLNKNRNQWQHKIEKMMKKEPYFWIKCVCVTELQNWASHMCPEGVLNWKKNTHLFCWCQIVSGTGSAQTESEEKIILFLVSKNGLRSSKII